MSDLQARLQAALGDAYQVERELGGGGMSRVFVATEASLHRAVVIKLLPPEFASEVSEARFKQEIELAAHLQHPNILPLLTAGGERDRAGGRERAGGGGVGVAGGVPAVRGPDGAGAHRGASHGNAEAPD